MSGMEDLADFLAARYDEAEALVRAAMDDTRHCSSCDPASGEWAVDPTHPPLLLDKGSDATVTYDESAPKGLFGYLVSVDPAHRLADIALKRAILAEHAPYDCGEPAVQRCTRCASDDAYPNGVAVMAAYPCATARQLGNEFSKHPGYKAGWAL
jgi:hypothetical protein